MLRLVQVMYDFLERFTRNFKKYILILFIIQEHIEIEAVSVGAVLSDYQRLRVENV